MAENAAVGQIYRLTFNSVLNGQLILNTQDYRLEVVPAGGTVFDAYDILLAHLQVATGVNDRYFGVCPANMTITSQWVQCIKPTRIIKKVFALNEVGLRGDADTPNIQQSITKRGEKATRYAVGGMRIPVGTTAADIAIGFLTGAQFSALSSLCVELKKQLGNGTTEMTWRPVVFNPSFIPNFTYVVDCVPQLTIRTAHRRTVGLGK